MGINQLYKLIQEFAPEAIEQVNFENFHHKKIAIDFSLIFYQFLMMNVFDSEEDKIASGLQYIINHAKSFVRRYMVPIYVFDGQCPQLKNDYEREKRREKYKQNFDKYEQAQINNDHNEMMKYKRLLNRLTSRDIEIIQDMLRLLGIPFIQAPGEAEAQCAYLSDNNIVDYVATEDMDSIPFRCKFFLRHFKNFTKHPSVKVNLMIVMEKFDVTYDELVDLCILCGCDYMPPIPRVGSKTAYKLIQQHRNIETILENETKYNWPEVFPYAEVRRLFKYPDVKHSFVGEELNFLEKDFSSSEVQNELYNFSHTFHLHYPLVEDMMQTLQQFVRYIRPGTQKTENDKLSIFDLFGERKIEPIEYCEEEKDDSQEMQVEDLNDRHEINVRHEIDACIGNGC